MYQNNIHFYVKYRRNECKFICLENSMVRVIEGKIYSGPFQVILKDINEENIAELKLPHVR